MRFSLFFGSCVKTSIEQALYSKMLNEKLMKCGELPLP